MTLPEMVDGQGLLALAGAAAVGPIDFCTHNGGVTIAVLQHISTTLTKHADNNF